MSSERPEWAKDDEDRWTVMGRGLVRWITAWSAPYEVPAKNGGTRLQRDPLRMYWHPEMAEESPTDEQTKEITDSAQGLTDQGR